MKHWDNLIVINELYLENGSVLTLSPVMAYSEITQIEKGDTLDYKDEKYVIEKVMGLPPWGRVARIDLMVTKLIDIDKVIEEDDNEELDIFHYHEVVHGCYMVGTMVDMHLTSHQVCEKEPELKKLLTEAHDKIIEAYKLAVSLIPE